MADELFTILRFLTTSYIGASVWFLLGVYMIYNNIKRPMIMRTIDPLQGAINGWIGAIGALVLSIAILCLKFTGRI